MSASNCETCDYTSLAKNSREIIEALMEIQLVCWKAGVSMGYDVACGIIKAKSRSALAKPPRNCDVGTPLEQYDRFDKICSAKRPFKDCPLFEKTSPCCSPLCFARWSQMPYEEVSVEK